VPPALLSGLRERDGALGRALLVFPTLSWATWQGDRLEVFVEQVRRIARAAAGVEPARVAGALPVSADIISSIRRDGPLASAVAFAGVVGLVALMFRKSPYTLAVVGSLTVGVLWLFATILSLGVRVNFANFIAFPITFGIGVDYAVNVMARTMQEGSGNIDASIRSTGAAVGLCSVTTTIGYSSPPLAKNQGLFLFGLVAVLGEVSCLLTAVVLLPAALVLWERRRSARPRERIERIE